MLTKDEFIEAYLDGEADHEREEFLTAHQALRCDCRQEGCKGWAMVRDTPSAIKAHKMLYAPTDGEQR